MLQLVVHFFWLPVIVAVIYEIYRNTVTGNVAHGIGSGFTTLLLWLVIWALLYCLMKLAGFVNRIVQVVTDVRDVQRQQDEFLRQSYGSPFIDLDRGYGQQQEQEQEQGRVVEGSITEVDDRHYKQNK